MAGKVLLLIGSVLLTLTVVELVLREFAPIYLEGIPESVQYDAQLGYRFRPGIHLLRTTDHQEEVRTNRLGTVNFQESFGRYKQLVFAIGDSFTEGAGVPADASYPFQLDMILNLDRDNTYQTKYGVVNLAISAVGGEQEVLILKRWAARIGRPAYVLYIGSDNDYEDDALFRSGYRHRHLVLGSPIWGWTTRPLQILTDDFQIGIRAKLVLATLEQHHLFRSAEVAQAEEEHPVAELERPELEKLRAESGNYGAKLIVTWCGSGPSYDWLKAWAVRNRVAFADWEAAVGSVKAAIPQLTEDNPHSGRHHRTWVNYLIAREFARQISAGDGALSQASPGSGPGSLRPAPRTAANVR